MKLCPVSGLIHASKTPQDFITLKEKNVQQWPSQPPDLNPVKHEFHLLNAKVNTKTPQGKTGTEDSCSKDVAQHHKQRNHVSGELYGYHT